MQKSSQKPILISGIQPSGRLHVGNYLGMLKQAVELQNSGKYNCFYAIVDLHSLTEEFDPKEKRTQIIELAADMIAGGLDPKKSLIFQQSQVLAHSELTWILSTITTISELRRMTQFKDKGEIDYKKLRIKSHNQFLLTVFNGNFFSGFSHIWCGFRYHQFIFKKFKFDSLKIRGGKQIGPTDS